MKPAVKIYRVIIVLVIIVTASFGVGIPVSLATDSISTFRQTGSNEPSEVTYTKDIAPILNK
ncbi:hypothetical protein, partial [Planktothrix sp. FACHB-1355]